MICTHGHPAYRDGYCPACETKRKPLTCGDAQSHLGHKDCPFCGSCTSFEAHGPFRDALSFKEYGISGLCQACQDDFFK
jgi:hypothetical protein